MTPATYHFEIKRGIDFSRVLQMQDANSNATNIAGYTAYAEMRKTPGSALVFDLAPNVSNGANGEVTLSCNQNVTANMDCGVWGWDLVLKNTSNIRLGPIMQGRVSVSDIHTHLV